MVVSGDQIKEIAIWLGAIGSLLGVMLALSDQITKALIKIKPAWEKVIKPLVKFVTALASLIIPHLFIIGAMIYWVATYYWEAGRLDLIITNQRVFITLVILLALPISMYSLLWCFLLLPKIRHWFSIWRSDHQQPPGGNGERSRRDQPLQKSKWSKKQRAQK